MKIFNTLTGKKDELPRREEGPIRMFVCGPTVYDEPHIGNARTALFFDAFVRYVRSRGRDVFYLQNITDVDDKIIQRATSEDTSWKIVARRFEKVFMGTMKALNITAVSRYARATDYIPEIVAQVAALVKTRHAYRIDGDGYYFDLRTFPSYGRLARRTVAAADDGVSRIDDSDKKRNRGDFCLWKFSPPAGGPGEPVWKTPLGAGRPGWHIEDTAIAFRFFGPQYDLHGGGMDLKFPHHEAEIAQAESVSGKRPYVKVWMHVGLLTVNGQKMSKSLGNFVTVSEMLQQYSGDAFRFMVLSHHYRSPMDYSDDIAAGFQEGLNGILKFLAKLGFRAKKKIGPAKKRSGAGKPDGEPSRAALTRMSLKMTAALEDDFNTPQALGHLFDFMGQIQPGLWTLAPETAAAIQKALEKTLKMLGFRLLTPEIPASIAELVKTREKFRRKAHFIDSDRLRKQMNALGYSVEDTPVGPFVWPEVSA